MLDVTGWHITWIQANKRAEGKNIRGTFQAFTESFQNGTMTLPWGEKSDPAGMFILDRKEAIIVIIGDFFFHCKILTDCILITIPSMYKSIVTDDALM